MPPLTTVAWSGAEAFQDSFLDAVAADLGLARGTAGRPVRLTHGGPGLSVRVSAQGAEVRFQDKPHLFRALSHLAAHFDEPGFAVDETRSFTTLGAMTDASRNAVATVATLKTFLRSLAAMGYNLLMIYMEDTFEIPEYPYFGYMRGRYTRAELKEIDDYAHGLGIEVVPCVQTLAHLCRFLHWRASAPLRDNLDILLVGDDETYTFLDALIRAVSSPFRSKRIHLGMDEAFEIGLGRYLTLHGPRNRFEIVNEHLGKVVEIGKKYGLKPIIWSDMFFRLADPSGDYAAEHIPSWVAEAIHPDVQLVYWDYFSLEKSFYARKLRQHAEMKAGTMFAGSVWTYNGYAAAYNKTFLTSLPAIDACKEAGVGEVLVTLWNDDGSETHFAQALYGLQMYAELSFGQGGDDITNTDFGRIDRRFHETTGASPEAFRTLDRIDNIKPLERNVRGFNTSKQAFYQDPLMGLFEKHGEGLGLGAHFEGLAQRFDRWARQSNRWSYLFGPLARYCEVLALKAEVGLQLQTHYAQGDLRALGRDVSTLRETARRVGVFHRDYKAVWDRDFKPFGGEVVDVKLGALRVRLEMAADRVQAYVEGQVAELPELAEPRLWYDGRTEAGEQQEFRFNRWHQMVTPGYISHNVL